MTKLKMFTNLNLNDLCVTKNLKDKFVTNLKLEGLVYDQNNLKD